MSGRLETMIGSVACLVAVGMVPWASAQIQGTPGSQDPSEMANPGASDLPPDLPDWGISSYIAYNVPAFAFNNRLDARHNFLSGYLFKSAGTSNDFDAPIYLPSGAVISGLTLFYSDWDAGADASVSFAKYTGSPTGGLTPQELLLDYSSGSGGWQGGYRALAVPETVRNVNATTGVTSMYTVRLGLAPSGVMQNLAFGGLTVWYRLQISPAPATATFSDVPTNYWAFRHIEALAASGITAGCASGNYCPESYVKRSEIAVYLAKALGLHWADANTLP